MNNVTVTPASVPAMVLVLAKELAKKAPKFLTMKVNAVLGVVAFVALMLYMTIPDRPAMMVAAVTLWATHLATLATIDIAKGVASEL